MATQRLQESLVKDNASHEDERDQYFGLSLRELVHTFKWQTLVLLKAMLLQPKVSSRYLSRAEVLLTYIDAILRLALRATL